MRHKFKGWYVLAASLAALPAQALAQGSDEEIDVSVEDTTLHDDEAYRRQGQTRDTMAQDEAYPSDVDDTAQQEQMSGQTDEISEQMGGTTDEMAGAPGEEGITVAREEELELRGLNREAFGVKPQAGALVFDNNVGDTDSRGMAGLTIDWNAGRLIGERFMQSRWYMGPSIGILYSRLGDTTSNFFGADSDVPNAPIAGLLLLPANLKFGYNVTDNFRVSARGGGNVLYRSDVTSINFGGGAADDRWRIYPNAGVDVEFGVARNVSVLVRPDYTFTPGANLFAGTLGVGFTLG